MTPLPATVPTKFNTWSDLDTVQSAYDRCLREEQRLMAECDQDPNTRWRLVCVRILGYFIHHAPTDDGARGIVSAINSLTCTTEDDGLRDLGGRYCQAWTQAFSESAKSRTPAVRSNFSSPGSSDSDTEPDPVSDSDALDPAPESHARAKKAALIRDDHRCVITKKYDRFKVVSDPALIARFESGELSVLGDIADSRCVHIFSESSGWNNSDKGSASDSDLWTALGYGSLVDELSGVKAHRLENVMTLCGDMQRIFDSLGIWFVETASPHTYTLEVDPSNAIYALYAKHYGPTVTFGTTDETLPRPSPLYLGIHAACARVAHLSGAAEWLKEFESNRDLDRHYRTTLANDGASVSLLHNVLWAHAMHSDVVP